MPVKATLDDFAVMSAPLSALIADYKQSRPPHALLLSGSAGIGKKTFARLLAQTVLCEASDGKPCNVCRACKRYLAGSHPDFLTVQLSDKEKTVKIDHLRDILDELGRHSFENGKRVVLLENAERMTVQAQNCLLKTLEEPDGETVFILTSDSEQALLPTVRSRCRVVRMQPWQDDAILRVLKANNIAENRCRELTESCNGSIGQALKMDGDAAYWKMRELADKTFFGVCKASDVPNAALLLKDTKDDADTLLSICESRLHNLLLTKAGLQTDPIPASLQNVPEGGLAKMQQAVFDARRLRASNVSWQAVSDRLLLTITEEINKWQQ